MGAFFSCWDMQNHICRLPEDCDMQDHISRLPEDCLSTVMKLTSPEDVCRSAAVCRTFKSVADSVDVWEHFRPFDPSSIFSRAEISDHMLLLNRKELFLHLSQNWINLDGGLKRFSLEFSTGAKRISLLKELLTIIDLREGAHPVLYIGGRIDRRDLSPDTNYVAYLIFTRTHVHHSIQNNVRNEFVDELISSVIGGISQVYRKHRTSNCLIYFHCRDCPNGVWGESQKRENGRWEIKLGNFRTCLGDDRHFHFGFFDEDSKLLKNELIVECVEVRPGD